MLSIPDHVGSRCYLKQRVGGGEEEVVGGLLHSSYVVVEGAMQEEVVGSLLHGSGVVVERVVQACTN